MCVCCSGIPLTTLDLTRCFRVTGRGIQGLRRIPTLTQLCIMQCEWGFEGVRMADVDVAVLRGLPIAEIDLTRSTKPGLSVACLGDLQTMPLTSLALGRWITDAGLWELRKLPMTQLWLYGCDQLSNAGLVALQVTKKLPFGFGEGHTTCRIRGFSINSLEPRGEVRVLQSCKGTESTRVLTEWV